MNPSRETNFSGAYRDREIFIFSIQLTTSRIGNLTRLIYSLLCVMTIHKYTHTYIHTHTDTRQVMYAFLPIRQAVCWAENYQSDMYKALTMA